MTTAIQVPVDSFANYQVPVIIGRHKRVMIKRLDISTCYNSIDAALNSCDHCEYAKRIAKVPSVKSKSIPITYVGSLTSSYSRLTTASQNNLNPDYIGRISYYSSDSKPTSISEEGEEEESDTSSWSNCSRNSTNSPPPSFISKQPKDDNDTSVYSTVAPAFNLGLQKILSAARNSSSTLIKRASLKRNDLDTVDLNSTVTKSTSNSNHAWFNYMDEFKRNDQQHEGENSFTPTSREVYGKLVYSHNMVRST